MNKLVLNSESLNNVLDNKEVSRDEAIQIYENALVDANELFSTSQTLRKKFKSNTVTFSKKAFFNLVNLCKDSCSYCTYKAEPGEEKLSLMSKSQVSELLDMAKKYRCVEVLFVTGEKPEEKYKEAREWLNKNGFASTAEYLIHASEKALEKGLFPHTNAGNLEIAEMRELKKTNVSMGLMLENISERLTERGMPHHLASSKRPKARMKILENSGKLKIPMTTGILVGIGETPEEIIDSIFAIKNIHQKYGNIQEVILQNFQPKLDTRMNGHPSANENYFKIIVALSRIIMPKMNIQIPPNLSPKSYQSFLSVGINDWGGISPLTPDYVNPEFAWPAINKVNENSKNAGFNLKCRFPAYPEFFSFLSKELRDKMTLIENEEGLVKEEYWR
ncbi:7,8-didemethyl-8-hydroxy-5-deazariboflavin synthase subunit CofG [Nitrosopumilus sp. K4]|uniref:7,8-didemethyl-8-hydroxy-5-deazariboflavin synthase subunit CofG n=1 Tax=Nitrosopumilus sp. K4 TaxID=2795383 RepID=UPI001BA84F6C|nr:7,8-didemethyl-8-hydroxy-5-deazariboflavin synthase subunit CofG [Nitrosopumilus sp. K4]QUC63890.1 7,8-didemethyl-8-hydroxy-5-deazariboflavin synthase subunit CofG [Nitrosopumilus sp. K4]